jgi:alpha-mannosidase
MRMTRTARCFCTRWGRRVSGRGGGFGADHHGVLLINDGIYGGDSLGNSIRLTLQRSPAYSAHAWEDLRYIPTDRFVPRMDQGERIFRFWIIPGERENLLSSADRLALERNQLPYSLQAFPSGSGDLPLPGLVLDNPAVILSSLRRDPTGNGWIFRLFNPTGQTQMAVVSWLDHTVGSFALAPYAFDSGCCCEETAPG